MAHASYWAALKFAEQLNSAHNKKTSSWHKSGRWHCSSCLRVFFGREESGGRATPDMFILVRKERKVKASL